MESGNLQNSKHQMTLKEAREKGKLAQFICEREKEKLSADATKFKKVVRQMARRKKKATQGASASDSSAS